MVVVGDWEDNSSHVVGDEAMEAAQRSSATIYAILDSDGGLQSQKSHKHAIDAAKRVTEGTGGLAYEVEERNDFARVLQAIGTAVTGSCRVEYTTGGNAGAKKGTKVRIEANSKDVTILYPRVRFSAAQ